MKYKAVIFDMFGTLVDSFPQDDYNALLTEMANIVGVEPRLFNETWVASFKPVSYTHLTLPTN